MTERQYHVRANGHVYGPVEKGKLESDAITGLLQPSMEVSEAGGPWVQAGELAWLFARNAKGAVIQAQARAGTTPYGISRSEVGGQRSVNAYLIFAVLCVIAGYLLPWIGLPSGGESASAQSDQGAQASFASPDGGEGALSGLSVLAEVGGYDLSRMAYGFWQSMPELREDTPEQLAAAQHEISQMLLMVAALALAPLLALIALTREIMSARRGKNPVFEKLLFALASLGVWVIAGYVFWQIKQATESTPFPVTALLPEDAWEIMRMLREGLYISALGTCLAWIALFINPKRQAIRARITGDGIEYESEEGEVLHA